MAAKKKPVKKTKKQSAVEGEVYVSIGGDYYTKPQINADTIKKALLNNYIAEQMDRLIALMFGDYYELKVYNEAGEEDDDLAKMIQHMLDKPGVELWSRMQQGWGDSYGWGCALFNPVWKLNGPVLELDMLRRLDPYSFRDSDGKDMRGYSRILRGISKTKEGTIRYVQTQTNGQMVEIKNITMLKNPTDNEIAGDSKIVPIVPVQHMLEFAWQAQIQKVNRIGAPIMFIKVTDPIVDGKRDDLKAAEKIIKNWGKNTSYQLRDNMEVIKLDFQDNSSAEKTIEMLEKRMLDFFSPATLIKKTGETIGGDNRAEVDLIKVWLKAQHRWVEDYFSTYPQHYLDVNGYEGYTCRACIPEPQPDRMELNINKARLLFDTRAAEVNEIRELAGLPPLEEGELKDLEEYYERVTQPQMGGFGAPGSAFQFIPVNNAESHRDGEDDKATKDLGGKLASGMDKLKAQLKNTVKGKEHGKAES